MLWFGCARGGALQPGPARIGREGGQSGSGVCSLALASFVVSMRLCVRAVNMASCMGVEVAVVVWVETILMSQGRKYVGP